MDEETIPLEAGHRGQRAISLTKGCYVGQEVIIRVLHRGHGRVARRLVGLVLDAEARCRAAGAPGTPARPRDRTRDERDLVAGARKAIALGYAHRDFTAPGTRVSSRTAVAAPSAVPPLVRVTPLTSRDELVVSRRESRARARSCAAPPSASPAPQGCRARPADRSGEKCSSTRPIGIRVRGPRISAPTTASTSSSRAARARRQAASVSPALHFPPGKLPVTREVHARLPPGHEERSRRARRRRRDDDAWSRPTALA